MPTYQARCDECGLLYEYRRSIAGCMETPACECCNGPTRKVILTAPVGFVTGKFEPFKSQVDGSEITCQSDLREHNKRNNVQNLHDGYDEKRILAGDFGQKPVVPDKKEIVQEIQGAIHKVSQGYKPKLVPEDDN